MNKKLLSVAVAAALAAPLSVQAGSDVTLYGVGKLAQEYVDSDGLAGTGVGDNVIGYDGWDTTSRASRLGVKGSEDLGSGLKAIFKMEFDIPMTDRSNRISDNDQGTIKMRNSYVGLSGDWGTAFFGRHDTPLKTSTGRLDLFSDRLSDYNATIGFVDVRADSTMTYISPSWNGLTFAGTAISPGGSTLRGTGGGKSGDADGFADAWSVALMYSNGPWFASGAYEYYDEDMIDDVINYDEEFTLWRLGAGYSAESWSIAAIYEGHKDDPTTSETDAFGNNDGGSDPGMWQIQGSYKFGNNAIKAMYGQYLGDDDNAANILLHGDDDNEDHESFAIGFDHNFSKRTVVFIEAVHYDSDFSDSDQTGGALGIHHKF